MPISPPNGPTSGGTTVTITGTGLSGTTAVSFGSKPATSFTNVSATEVTAVSPPQGAGEVGLTLTTPGGVGGPVPFYYIAGPTATNLSPSSGPTAGGTTVTITGSGLATASNVNFGTVAATPTVVSDSSITVTSPAQTAAGPVSVTITTAGGSVDGLSFNYVGIPTFGSIAPGSGSTAGGYTATITGTNYSTTSSVTIGGTAAAFGVISDTTIAVTVPPGTAGTADVVVTTAGGTTTGTGAFTYTSAPSI